MRVMSLHEVLDSYYMHFMLNKIREKNIVIIKCLENNAQDKTSSQLIMGEVLTAGVLIDTNLLLVVYQEDNLPSSTILNHVIHCKLTTTYFTCPKEWKATQFEY